MGIFAAAEILCTGVWASSAQENKDLEDAPVFVHPCEVGLSVLTMRAVATDVRGQPLGAVEQEGQRPEGVCGELPVDEQIGTVGWCVWAQQQAD